MQRNLKCTKAPSTSNHVSATECRFKYRSLEFSTNGVRCTEPRNYAVSRGDTLRTESERSINAPIESASKPNYPSASWKSSVCDCKESIGEHRTHTDCLY